LGFDNRPQLKDALGSGIISHDEYATKLAAMKAAVSAEVKNAEKTAAKEAQIAKLQAAREAGF
jgi:hypothetical protein